MANTVEQDDLPQPVAAIIEGLQHGDRHPVDDAEEVEVHDELDLALHHQYCGYEVILRYSIWTAWHDGNGPMEEFDFFEIES